MSCSGGSSLGGVEQYKNLPSCSVRINPPITERKGGDVVGATSRDALSGEDAGQLRNLGAARSGIGEFEDSAGLARF